MAFATGPSTPTSFQNPWIVNTEGQSAWSTQVQIAESTANNTLPESGSREITKSHWKSTDNSSCCSNHGCKKKFTLLERSHHCRRCGRIFCNACVQYKRKLNLLANPDPDGKSYKVCKSCFDEGRNNEGQFRRLTDHFLFLRQQSGLDFVIVQNGLSTKSWRNRFNLEKECQRLIDGFRSCIGTSEVKRTLQEITNFVSIPDWQKSATWLKATQQRSAGYSCPLDEKEKKPRSYVTECVCMFENPHCSMAEENMSETCRTCSSKFGLTKSKVNCKVCGCAVCKSCSSKDLLLYIPNDQVKKKEAEPKLCIIKLVGCPEKEPEVAMYLRVCKQCKDKLTQRQIDTVSDSTESEKGEDNVAVLVNIDRSFQQIRQKLDVQLTEYQNVIESLHDNSTQGKESGKSNIKTLAKAQVDIGDFLAQYVEKIQGLKRMKPETNTQAMLFRNCLKSKCDYYFESTFTFRQLKRKLDESAPEETLRIIQLTVNQNAIVSVQVYLRQLVYESIHLCDKHGLGDDIPQTLSSLDEVVETEAKQCLMSDGEDWDEHQSHINEMIKQQMKKHQLIRLSRRQLRSEGTGHAMTMLNRRSVDILGQIQVQLEMKSTNRTFKTTKKVLEQTFKKMKSLKPGS